MPKRKYRKHVRLNPEQYKKGGYYFVTICTDERKPYFKDAKKEIVDKELHNIPQRFAGWSVDFRVVMPDHIHMILASKGKEGSLAEVIGAFKSLVAKRFREDFDIEKSPWQKNYYEHVIRNEKALKAIRKYIMENPEQEEIDVEDFYEEDGGEVNAD